ncbi:hypothetical protein DPMN_017829 [Dreissena polymorpha]|uniref:Uncharacterized protein n=1 Tax=Dreissena polymorpha TaxID=45954 RepID=A0A9D4NH92_DREPO|nr:hypothetical protein DPMN_017829 [Dreissena polymorpha]
MVYNAVWRASSSYANIYSYEVSMKSAKALPRYGSGHKSAGRTDSRTDEQRQNNIPPSLAGDLIVNLCTCS